MQGKEQAACLRAAAPLSAFCTAGGLAGGEGTQPARRVHHPRTLHVSPGSAGSLFCLPPESEMNNWGGEKEGKEGEKEAASRVKG